MPGDKVQVLGQQPGEKESLKRVYYAGTETIKNGYAFCYNRDIGTATAVDWERASEVERPLTGKLDQFAGLAVGLPSAGKAGPIRLTLVDGRLGQVCLGYCKALTYAHLDILKINADDFELTNAVGGHPVAQALQATTLASAGALQILLDGGA